MNLPDKMKCIFAASIATLLVLPVSNSFADSSKAMTNSNIMGAEIEIVKYPKVKGAGKVRADELIKLAGSVALDAQGAKNARKLFEVAQHKKSSIWSAASISAKYNLITDSNIRSLAREEFDGFSVKWDTRLRFNTRFMAAGHSPSPLEKHNFYFVVDTDDDQLGDRVYKVFYDFKNKKKSNIKGYAHKVDGSSITPLEAKNAGL